MLGAALQSGDQFLDLFGGLLRAQSQAAHFIGDHGKAAPGFTGTRRFNRGIECQQVGLFGH
ncbi:hypothetical protein D3C84_1151760 [compost metagenome]